MTSHPTVLDTVRANMDLADRYARDFDKCVLEMRKRDGNQDIFTLRGRDDSVVNEIWFLRDILMGSFI